MLVLVGLVVVLVIEVMEVVEGSGAVVAAFW